MTDEVIDQSTEQVAIPPATVIDVKSATPPAADPAKPAADKKPAKEEPVEIVYEPTGDAKLDVALAFFGRAGLDADHDAIKAAVMGDFSLLSAYLEEKNVPGWQSHVKLAQESHAKFAEEKAAGEQKIVGAVAGALEKAGYSNEQWAEAINWARENADEDEIAGLNEMLSKPFTAKVAVAYLTGMHREASGVEYTPQKSAIKEEASARQAAATDTTPITRAQFSREAEKLAKSFGPDYMSTKEYRALRARIR